MFKKILIPLDGSTLATSVLPYSQLLARATGADITLLSVLEPESTTHVDPVGWRLRKVEANNYLQEISDTLDEDIAVERILLEGKSADRIVEYTKQNEIDLLVLCSHGRGGLNDWNISSIGQKVIQRVDKSVFLIRASHDNMETATEEIAYKRILVPLDGSQRAESVLPVAMTLAQQNEAELLLVHVVDQPTLLQRIPPTAGDIELLEQLTHRNQEVAEEYFDYLQGYLPMPVQTRVIVSDNVMVKLHDVVKEEGIDLVLLNAHGSSGLDQWPYGSMVTNFIQYGSSSLLIMQDLPPHHQSYGARSEHDAPKLLFNALTPSP